MGLSKAQHLARIRKAMGLEGCQTCKVRTTCYLVEYADGSDATPAYLRRLQTEAETSRREALRTSPTHCPDCGASLRYVHVVTADGPHDAGNNDDNEQAPAAVNGDRQGYN